MMSLKELVATKSSVTYAIMILVIWFGSTVVAQFNLYAPIPIQNIIMLLAIILLLLMSRKTDQSENKTTITPDFLIPLEKVTRDITAFQTTIQDMLRAQVTKDDSVKEEVLDMDLLIHYLKSLFVTKSEETPTETIVPNSNVEGGTVG